MRKFLIKINGNQYEVEVEEIKEETAGPRSANNVSAIETSKPVEQKKDINMPEGVSAVTAPMPGTILKVNVNVGDVVKKGQVLLVLEAMKMENEITAPVDGKITSLHVEKGKSVGAGEALLAIA